METIYDIFQDTFKDIKIKRIGHLIFFMKHNPKLDKDEFLADINIEDHTMYFSYLKSWEKYQEDFGMTNEAISSFLAKSVYDKFGYIIIPY